MSKRDVIIGCIVIDGILDVSDNVCLESIVECVGWLPIEKKKKSMVHGMMDGMTTETADADSW